MQLVCVCCVCVSRCTLFNLFLKLVHNTLNHRIRRRANLCHICTVQAINAIGPNYTTLLQQNLSFSVHKKISAQLAQKRSKSKLLATVKPLVMNKS
jgi:hypothetical protein